MLGSICVCVCVHQGHTQSLKTATEEEVVEEGVLAGP